jgi:hypothetical protein
MKETTRELAIVFVKDYKTFVDTFSKKCKSDYVLNINKLVKEKFQSEIFVPNKVQAFLLNYEISKLIDKVVKIKNQKYTRLIYLNTELSSSGILNSITFLKNTYDWVDFDFKVIDKDKSISPGLKGIKNEAISLI